MFFLLVTLWSSNRFIDSQQPCLLLDFCLAHVEWAIINWFPHHSTKNPWSWAHEDPLSCNYQSPQKIEAPCDIRKNLATKIQGIRVDCSPNVNKICPSPNNPPVWGLEKKQTFFEGGAIHHITLVYKMDQVKLNMSFMTKNIQRFFQKRCSKVDFIFLMSREFFQGLSNIFLAYPFDTYPARINVIKCHESTNPSASWKRMISAVLLSFS